MIGPLPGSLKNDFEISQSDEWVIKVLVIIIDLFQNGTENGTFRHPTRDTFGLVIPNCRFLYDDTNCCVVTRDGTFTKVFKDVGRSSVFPL